MSFNAAKAALNFSVSQTLLHFLDRWFVCVVLSAGSWLFWFLIKPFLSVWLFFLKTQIIFLKNKFHISYCKHSCFSVTLNLEPFEYVQKFCSHLVANAVLNLKVLLERGWPVNKISKREVQICITWSWTCWAMWEDTCTCDWVWSKYLKWGNDKHLWQLHSSPPQKNPKSPHVWCVRLDRAAYLALKKGGESLITSALQESFSELESETGKPEFLLLRGNVKIFFKLGKVWFLVKCGVC